MATDGDKAVWYFAYGSNMKSAVMHRRGMKPLAVKRLVVPSHVLTFDIFGVPYSEPAMASIAERRTVAVRGGGGGVTGGGGVGAARTTGDLHETPASHLWPPPVHGVGYLLSAADFLSLVVSEGAGTAYSEVEVQARLLDADNDDNDDNDKEHERGMLTVHTLVGRYPFRPNPLPSTRYLGLLIDGAEEHSLPGSYRDYLAALPSYTKSLSSTEAFGARVFLGVWMPIITRVMTRIKKTAARGTGSGRSNSPSSGVFVWLLFSTVWLHYDLVHCRLWGHGGGRRP